MIKALIIDDESDARRTLRNLLSTHCPEVTIIEEADSVSAGMLLLQHVSADVVFLDIHLKDGTGFDLLDRFPKPAFRILFTTAHDQFALRAFKYHAVDYLLKPIDPNELISAVSKLKASSIDLNTATEQLSRLLLNIKTKEFKTITLSTQEGLYILPLERIIRLQSNGNYTTFCTVDGEKIMVARTLKEYEDILPKDLFFRIHRSHIVNLSAIKGVMKEEGGYALTTDDIRLPIARRKKEPLIERLKSSSLQ